MHQRNADYGKLQDKPPNFCNKILPVKIKDVGEGGVINSGEGLRRQLLSHSVRNHLEADFNKSQQKNPQALMTYGRQLEI